MASLQSFSVGNQNSKKPLTIPEFVLNIFSLGLIHLIMTFTFVFHFRNRRKYTQHFEVINDVKIYQIKAKPSKITEHTYMNTKVLELILPLFALWRTLSVAKQFRQSPIFTFLDFNSKTLLRKLCSRFDKNSANRRKQKQ